MSLIYIYHTTPERMRVADSNVVLSEVAGSSLDASAEMQVSRLLRFSHDKRPRGRLVESADAALRDLVPDLPDEAARLERCFNDETNRRMRPMRATVIAFVFLAYLINSFISTDPHLLAGHVTGTITSLICCLALASCPRFGSEILCTALICVSGASRARGRDGGGGG